LPPPRNARTTASLKAAYDQTMDEVKSMFHDANQRFADASRELREAAQEVQNSLESTRQELKRGAFELPHETQEGVAAMRRVVADQIRALAELNTIVTRHGRSDLADGGDAEIVAAGIRRLASPHREPTLVAEAPARITHAPRSAPAEPRRGAARASAEIRRLERASRDGGDGGERGGWLTDALSRATRGDEGVDGERSPLHAIESLDSLSVDIARMIEHDAAVEFWDRYRRVERNVLSRRLYSKHGQQAFEEIRNRYRRSSDFRETVDRYIGEFERLLEQVSRDDRGQVLSKTYLTSDTGKVYTLLAHAAGKLN
jgi:hypothetical protein